MGRDEGLNRQIEVNTEENLGAASNQIQWELKSMNLQFSLRYADRSNRQLLKNIESLLLRQPMHRQNTVRSLMQAQVTER